MTAISHTQGTAAEHACCGSKAATAADGPAERAEHPAARHAGHAAGWRGAASVTLHCLVDFQMGGVRGVSLVSSRYWDAFALALLAGYLCAWPVNGWMLGRNMKRCQ